MTAEYDKDEVVQAYLQTRTIRGTSKKTGIETKALLHILEELAEEIAYHQEREYREQEMDAAWIKRRARELIELDPRDFIDEDGKLLPPAQWPDTAELLDFDIGPNGIRVKCPGKSAILQMAGNHVDIGAFREKLEVSSSDIVLDTLMKARRDVDEADG